MIAGIEPRAGSVASVTWCHDWILSTLGHGDTMCRRCLMTNLEAAALGLSIKCDVPPKETAVPESKEMPRYRCHKIVHALTIRNCFLIGLAPTAYQLDFEEEGFASITVPPDMLARFTPKRGDYYVVYDDGYQSVSPKKAFEEGYTKIEDGALAPCPLCGSKPVEEAGTEHAHAGVSCSNGKCILHRGCQDDTNRHVLRADWPKLVASPLKKLKGRDAQG